MKTTPILFRPDMARAWAEDRKGRTQRVITKVTGGGNWKYLTIPKLLKRCPYGGSGDRLQLLTTWATMFEFDDKKPSELHHNVDKYDIWTYFDGPEKPEWCGRLRCGRFMPQWIRDLMPTPKIISIKADQIQYITDEEILEEGITAYPNDKSGARWNIRDEFQVLWDQINAPRGYPWSANPWRWNIRLQKRSEI